MCNTKSLQKFLLTRLIRGATAVAVLVMFDDAISTHAPHTRRDVIISKKKEQSCISTHAPHTRRDFRSRTIRLIIIISTHAPHTRRDVSLIVFNTFEGLFLLTRLIRGATKVRENTEQTRGFLLTRLIRGATVIPV